MARANVRVPAGASPVAESRAKRMADRLRRHYRLGQKANASALSAKDFGDAQRIGEHLMRKFKRFAREYTPRDLDELCNTLRPNGLPLQWGHVNYLLSIPDRQERQAMQQRAIVEGWTAPQLARAITRRRRTESGHGRPMRPPTTAEAGLEQLMAEAQMWIRRCQVVMTEVERGRRKGRDFRRQAERIVQVLEDLGLTADKAKAGIAALLSRRSSR